MKALTVLNKALVDLEKIADKMNETERRELTQKLEAISLRAGEMAGYFDARFGSGCGDQGHKIAVKQLNRAGKKIWMKVFGYNAYHDISF